MGEQKTGVRDQGAIRSEIEALLSIKRSIDAGWAEGKRGMLAANVWAIAESAQKLFAAYQTGDAAAYYEAAQQARERAFSATIHGRNWMNAAAAAELASDGSSPQTENPHA